MPDQITNKKQQIFISNGPEKERYISPRQGYSKEFATFPRERAQHGQRLVSQISSLQIEIPSIKKKRKDSNIPENYGIYIEFESEEGFELKFSSLENIKSGIEVENVRKSDNKTYATVYVPDGKLKLFLAKIHQYIEKNKNKELIGNISTIRIATLKAFWTGRSNFDNIPLDEDRWWEIWNRAGDNALERNQIDADFLAACSRYSIIVKEAKIEFPERTVRIIKASINSLSSSLMILNCLAELRESQETAETIVSMPLVEQLEWASDLSRRITYQSREVPAVALIDTGVNNGHPLLSESLSDEDMLSYDLSWGVNDDFGHGTEMAGLALYGDLFSQLISNSEIHLIHKLESIKLLSRRYNHDPELYGAITQECIYRLEINAPQRKRICCLAITSKDNRNKGRPTSWSAAMDQISFGELDDMNNKRLVLIAAGNVNVFENIYSYPETNFIEPIDDPGQSWNSITVGGFTKKTSIDAEIQGEFIPIASQNELSPSSSTSVSWERRWPLKPEIVLEAGNYAINMHNHSVADPDSLRLLTTFHRPYEKLFTVFGDTSAATAQASRIAAIVQSHYPGYWPETLRGVLIHSAEWTNEMLEQKKVIDLTLPEKVRILRKYGYGVPNLERAVWCSSNYLTLIIQAYIKPYVQESADIKTDEVNFHILPWPKTFFQEIGAVNIRLKITLSYFIEPNPTQREYWGKYDYSSHGLRFDLKKGTDTLEVFKKRINKRTRETDEDTSYSGLKWALGPNARNLGSIHSDYWVGPAAELAEMDTVAIFPVSGWWRFRKKLVRWNNIVRYSLIISLEIKSPEIDIYTPVYNFVNTPIQVFR